ncbi:MAG: TIGR02221 family CRISPR-associated protein [Magnetococcales bacterium]|nr:TIGR02221 family CRISPR-associated protein [Magnetococcales bacterium]
MKDKKILISFLGKARDGGEYRSQCYRFDDGQKETSRFFGLTLARREQPDEFILLGTSSSMWDVLFTDLGNDEKSDHDLTLLIEEVGHNTVGQERLDNLTPLLEKHLGMSCRPMIIPFGRTTTEQMDILEILSETVAEGDQVSMDLTHGFRHLPMLGFLSALFLKEVKKARIEGLYYGAADMQMDGEAPVVRLDGLLNLAEWIGAIGRYDQGGDYGVFAPLLRREQETRSDIALKLEEASFFERINNSSKARTILDQFSKNFFQGNDESFSPAARLFRKPLEKRISWWRGKEHGEREGVLAWHYLRRGDFLRAVIYGYESRVTRWVLKEKLGDPSHFDRRKEAADDLKGRFKSFDLLSRLRNALAHGIPPTQDEVLTFLSSRVVLERKLREIFKDLEIREE